MHSSKSKLKSPRRYKKQTKSKNDIVCTPLKPTSSSHPFEEYHPSAGLFEEEKDIEGGTIFKVTPSKPKAISKDETESAELLSAKGVSSENKTKGHSSRQNMKKELRNLQTSLNLESDPEDSDESLSDENSSDTDEKGPSGKSIKTFSKSYFSAHKQKRASTSNRTLSHLKLKQLDLSELQNLLEVHHVDEKLLLMTRYESQFHKWKFLLHAGFNVLLYGIGSKGSILNEFCKRQLSNEVYVTVHGFSPCISYKQILSTITDEALEHEGKFSNIDEHTEFIKKHFSNSKEKLYLIIHNIDGMSLRGVKVQTLLSTLASASNIHFLVSVDHINCPLIWNQTMLSQFQWVWMDCSTFEPYVLETSHETSLMPDQGGPLLLSSLLHVTQSLTENGRRVFYILAEHQKNSNSGITFHEWYQECREAFLVNSEITMQAQLSEFKNHKLLTCKKTSDGVELWHIPVDSATLEQFLESCK